MRMIGTKTGSSGYLKPAAIFLVCAAVAGFSGCKKQAGSAAPPPVPEVSVMTVAPQTIPDDPEFIGQAESSRPVEIRSQVTGIIKERFFQEGREVKKGNRLYQIDPVPFRAAVLSAKAVVAQDEARLVQAKQNLDRVKPLLAEQAVSQKDVDDAVAEELAAEAALEAAKGQLVKAQFDLDNTLIIAPIAGLIERTRFYEGRLISAQTDLLTIIDQVDPIYITVNAPESYLLQRRRELAEKKVQRPDLYELRGVITFVDGTIYPHEGVLEFADVVYRVETGSRQGRFVFPNPDKVLLPGQYVTLRVKGYTRQDAILVPQRAVQQGPTSSILYVVGAGDKVEIRDVQATGWHGNQWLIEKGLRAGERVVVDGLQRIMPGAQVKPVAWTPPKDTTAVSGDKQQMPSEDTHAAAGDVKTAPENQTSDAKKEDVK
jgi:membrane fusion protein (multidrug efflux system)